MMQLIQVRRWRNRAEGEDGASIMIGNSKVWLSDRRIQYGDAWEAEAVVDGKSD